MPSFYPSSRAGQSHFGDATASSHPPVPLAAPAAQAAPKRCLLTRLLLAVGCYLLLLPGSFAQSTPAARPPALGGLPFSDPRFALPPGAPALQHPLPTFGPAAPLPPARPSTARGGASQSKGSTAAPGTAQRTVLGPGLTEEWAARYNGPTNSYDQASALAVDAAGSVYVTGYSFSNSTSADYVTVKYDGATGQQQWVARYNGPANDYDQAYALAVDAAGSVYVTGASVGNSDSYDYATLKYDGATGAQQWVARYKGPANANDQASALAVDATGSVYVTGYSVGGSSTGYDYATVKYSQVTATPPVLSVSNLAVPAAAGQCSAPVTLAATATGTPAPTITYALASGPIAAAYTFPVGVTSVTATATNSAGTDKKTFTVTVTDTERPTITAPAAVAVGTDAGQCTASSVALGTATAADNCSGVTVTNDAPATFAKGTTTVTWTATDASGNQATATQTVTVRDTERPVLAALPNLRVSAPAAACGAVVSFVPSASDNCPGTTVVASPAAGSTFALGTTTVTVTATDAAGNTATSSFTVTVSDVTPPTAITRNLSVALVNGTATITAAQLNNGSADACGAVTLALSKTSFTCANAGANTVTLTVTDAAGNVATAPATVTVTGGAVAPSISVAPASLFDGKQYRLYLGYGPQTATLTASGGTSYTWSPATGLSNPNVASPVFAPTAEGTYTFTVTATSAGGCRASSTVTIVVEDVRCGNNNDKVQVCHNGQAICVASSALNVHLSHGDQLGSCAASREAAVLAVAPATSATTSALAVYPNPTAGAATLTGATPGASVTVLDAVGRVVLAATADATGTAALALPAELPSGVYVVRAGQQAVRLTVE